MVFESLLGPKNPESGRIDPFEQTRCRRAVLTRALVEFCNDYKISPPVWQTRSSNSLKWPVSRHLHATPSVTT